MLYLLYVIVRFLTRPLVGRRGDASAKDLQILVLRHQLRVLRRKTGPPEVHAAQPVGAGGRERSLHRSAWASFPVSPHAPSGGTASSSGRSGHIRGEVAPAGLRSTSALRTHLRSVSAETPNMGAIDVMANH